MLKFAVAWLMLPIVVLLTSCSDGGLFEDASVRATREANEQLQQQTLIFVETQAATIVALQETVDSANAMATQIVQLDTQNQALRSTLQASGQGNVAPQGPAPPAGQPSGEITAAQQADNTFGTPIPAQSQSQNGTTYRNPTTAQSVRDSDGCAEESTTTFQPTEDRIYLVVQAQNVQPGTTYYSRWTYGNQNTFETVTYVPDQVFDSLCIWFFVTPQDINFTPGNWQVQLIADEQAVARVSFTIAGEPPGGATPEGGTTNPASGGGFVGGDDFVPPPTPSPLPGQEPTGSDPKFSS